MINIKKTNKFENGSRMLDLIINSKAKKTPLFYPQISRANDLNDIMETYSYLEKNKKPKLENIGGFILEAHSALTAIKKNRVLRQQTMLLPRKTGFPFKDFYQLFNEYNLPFLIDPNLDRLDEMYYKERFKKLGTDFFTQEILKIANKKEKIPLNLFTNPDLHEKILKFQIDYHADEIIAPYIPIDFRNPETLEITLSMFKSSLDIQQKLFKKFDTLLPVICIKKNVLKNLKGAEKLQEKIINSFSELDAPAYFIKITDFDTQSISEPYDEILKFFKRLKNKIDKPVIFLNLNEFSYILFRYGLDGYSCRLSRSSGRDIPRKNNKDSEEIRENCKGKFYLQNKMHFVFKKDIKKLNCSCPFCKPYDGIDVEDIPVKIWLRLRIKHYLWCKNEEIRMLKDEMPKNSLRVALKDMFARSKNYKIFVEYL